jgi:hypothetical protein
VDAGDAGQRAYALDDVEGDLDARRLGLFAVETAHTGERTGRHRRRLLGGTADARMRLDEAPAQGRGVRGYESRDATPSRAAATARSPAVVAACFSRSGVDRF